MKNRFLIILGICVALSVGASVATTKMVIQPANSTSLVCFSGSNVQENIIKYSKMGYIVTHITSSSDEYSREYFVIMEKY